MTVPPCIFEGWFYFREKIVTPFLKVDLLSFESHFFKVFQYQPSTNGSSFF